MAGTGVGSLTSSEKSDL